jgi:hypothetical protein
LFLTELVDVVRAVQVFEAKKRKPVYFGDVTVYGANDEWQFVASFGANMCPECEGYHDSIYFGTSLRGDFEYHVIMDVNLIYAKVHPNCSCTLIRVGMVKDEPTPEPKKPEIKYNIKTQPGVVNQKDVITKLNKTLNELPSSHVKTVKGFKIIRKNPYSPAGRFDGIDIEFREDTMEGDKSKHIIYHEVGHSFFYRKLDYNAQMKWYSFWGDDIDDMPTDYSKTHFREGFAECYSIYYNKAWEGSRLSSRVVQYMEEVTRA